MNRHKHYDLIVAWAEGHKIEVYVHAYQEWQPVLLPAWNPDTLYRLAPIKPSIDWDHVNPEYIALAVDDDGQAFLYTEVPHSLDTIWGCTTVPIRASVVVSFDPGNCHWKDSLITRPRG